MKFVVPPAELTVLNTKKKSTDFLGTPLRLGKGTLKSPVMEKDPEMTSCGMRWLG